MGETSLYDEDVFAWSEQQAAALRRLAARRDLPNELDLPHIAEEIEDVGASQLQAVKSLVRLILVHAIKCWADPQAQSIRHWAAETANWQSDLADRMTPAMRGRIDMAVLWQRAVHQAMLDLAAQQQEEARTRVGHVLGGAACPVPLDELPAGRADMPRLVQYIADAVRATG